MLRVVTVAAQQAVSVGGGIQIANAVRVCMAAGLTFLVMRQVMPIAAGLASGLALSSFGVVSAALAWGFGSAVRSTAQFARGLTDGQTNRWDPLSRQAGHRVRRGVMRAALSRDVARAVELNGAHIERTMQKAAKSLAGQRYLLSSDVPSLVERGGAEWDLVHQ